MSDEFITIKEAAELAGLSKKSIERRYKKLENDEKYGEWIEKRLVGNSYRYFVTRSFVEECVIKETKEKASKAKSISSGEGNAMLQQTIDMLSRELESKSKTIETMLERQHETNVLLKSLQERLPQLTEVTDSEAVKEGSEANEEIEKTKQGWLARVLKRQRKIPYIN